MPATLTWREFLRLGWGWWFCIVALMCMATAIAAMISWLVPHVPRVHDEFSHMLVADTLLHGRLSNPVPDVWQPFQTFHVILQPTYASKYPLGPGASIALGWWLLGVPIAGSWLAAGLCVGCAVWMLAGIVSRSWALFAGALLALHPAMQISWSQTLYGGWLTAAASCMVVGAVLRLRRKTDAISGVVLGCGTGLLALCRPYEGLVLTVGALLALGFLMTNQAWSQRLRNACRIACWSLGPVALALLITLAHNHATTGSYLRMPYQVHESHYGVAPLFVFGQSKVPDLALEGATPKIVQTYHQGWSMDSYLRRTGWTGWMIGLIKGWIIVFTYWGLAFAILPLATFMFWLRTRVGIVALGAISLQLCCSAAVCWVFPHYLSPILPWLLVATAVGIRRSAAHARWLRRSMLPALLAGQLCLLTMSVLAHVRDSRSCDWAVRRAEIAQRLAGMPGRHLVIVEYSEDHNVHQEWVYNEAEPDQAKIIWARGENSQWRWRLHRRYETDRTIWLLRPDQGTELELIAPPSRCSQTKL